ncbi:MAG: hypothetical protein H0X28_13875 [Solirubrobacterales bacterium]|nr:hypothetical protein [Solirubrobacterales bacterium]
MPISFNILLLERPEGLTIIGKGEPPTGECPGTVGNPQAASGNLCIYVGGLVGGTLFTFDPDNSGDRVKGYGTILGVNPDTESASGYGTWAVTG